MAMYAVIASGGKQARVAEGEQVHVELLDAEQGSEVSLTPVLVVDGDTVLATPAQLEGCLRHGQGRRLGAGPEDRWLHLQAAHQPAPSVRAPPEVPRRRDHLDQEGLNQDVKDQRWRFNPQRPRLQRAAPRREGLRRQPDPRPARSSFASAAPSSTRAATSASVATTRCSRSPTAP